jgi:SAM-dependent methyltransferase
VLDWGLGKYEITAQELEPAAREVVALAAPGVGERVLDLACGTGNAALLAASRGATVTGVDGAPRLIDVARERALQAGLPAEFLVGDLHQPPLPDGAFDVVLSVFGLIFADDPALAFGEMLRLMAPGGRAYLAAWIPGGTIGVATQAFGKAVAAATGRTRNQFPWHEPGALAELAPVEVTMHERTLAITAESPDAYFRDHMGTHPMSVAMRPVLERAGSYEQALAESQAIIRARNENPDGFLITSAYRIAEIRQR